MISRIKNHYRKLTALASLIMIAGIAHAVDINNVTGEVSNVNVMNQNEQSAGPSNTAGTGKIWVKDDAPTTLWFTDDAGSATQLGLFSANPTLDAIDFNTSATDTIQATRRR